MPNHCDNWVRISGDPHVLLMFESQPFDLEMAAPLPEEMRPEIVTVQKESDDHIIEAPTKRRVVDRSEWIQEHWGTRWIAPLDDHYSQLRLSRDTEGALQAHFISAWSPPIPFYNRLAEKYPSIKIEYEYTEWGMEMCGYGVGSPGGKPTHYNFGSPEEINELKALRHWNVCIWSPHFSDMICK